MPLVLENTHPVSPLLLASDQSLDISDVEDSDLDDDLPPNLDSVTTIPIPENAADAKNIMTQAKVKHKAAILKCKLANANFREAVLKAKICHSRAQHAKRVSDATRVYLQHINWTIQRSRDVWSKPSYEVVSMADSSDTKVNHFVNIPGGDSIAISLD